MARVKRRPLTASEALAEVLARYPGAVAREDYPGRVGDPWLLTCPRGHDVKPRLSTILLGHDMCRFCAAEVRGAARRLSQSEAEETVIKLLSKRGIEPPDSFSPYPGLTDEPWEMRCSVCGSTSRPTLSELSNGAYPCVPCARREGALKRGRSQDQALSDLRQALTESGRPFPAEIGAYPGSSKKQWAMKCACGEWSNPTLSSLMRGQGYCKTCGYGTVSQKKARYSPEQAARQLEISLKEHGHRLPKKIGTYPGYIRRGWEMVCADGHDCSPTLFSIIEGGNPCRTCAMVESSASRRLSHEQALEQLLSALDSRGEPHPQSTDRYPGRVSDPWSVVCALGHSTRTTLLRVRNGIQMCGRCSGNAPYTEDEARTALLEALDLHGHEHPSVIREYPGRVSDRWDMVCARGHDCAPRLKEIRMGGGVCSSCSSGGFKVHEPACLYLMSAVCNGHLILNFGITNDLSRRIRQHRNKGGLIILGAEVLYSDRGQDMLDVENQIKSLVRELPSDVCIPALDLGIALSTPTEELVWLADEPSGLKQLLDVLGIVPIQRTEWLTMESIIDGKQN